MLSGMVQGRKRKLDLPPMAIICKCLDLSWRLRGLKSASRRCSSERTSVSTKSSSFLFRVSS